MQIEQLPEGVSVVIPVYNSKGIIPVLVSRLEPELKKLGTDFELIMVNDGSCDDSWASVKSIAAQKNWIFGINSMKNYGQHNALLCGIRKARFNTIVTMDDDLQHPPEEIVKLINKLNEGYIVAYGKPQNPRHNTSRKLALRFIRIV